MTNVDADYIPQKMVARRRNTGPGGRGAPPLTLLRLQLPDLRPAQPADTGGVREEDAREEEPIEMYLFYVYFQCSILVY